MLLGVKIFMCFSSKYRTSQFSRHNVAGCGGLFGQVMDKELSPMARREKITFERIDSLEVDEDNNLYWEGRRLQTATEVRLGFWLNLAVFLGGVGGFGVFVVEVYKLFW
jgi:hypothetical protein